MAAKRPEIDLEDLRTTMEVLDQIIVYREQSGRDGSLTDAIAEAYEAVDDWYCEDLNASEAAS